MVWVTVFPGVGGESSSVLKESVRDFFSAGQLQRGSAAHVRRPARSDQRFAVVDLRAGRPWPAPAGLLEWNFDSQLVGVERRSAVIERAAIDRGSGAPGKAL